MTSRRGILFSCSIALALGGSAGAACSGPGDDGGVTRILSVAVGVPTDCGTGFQPLQDDDNLEILVGFQGWQFVQLRYAVEGSTGDTARVAVTMDIAGLGPRIDFDELDLLEDPGGGAVTSFNIVFLTDVVLADLIGRTATVSVSLAAGEGERGDAEVTVELRNDDPKIHNGACGIGTDAGTS